MDPLSIAASIAGLYTLADRIFIPVFQYGRAMKTAKCSIGRLAEEIQILSTILRNLQALALDLAPDHSSLNQPSLQIPAIVQIRTTLQAIENNLKPAIDDVNGATSARLIRQIKWPFSETQTHALLEDLSRHKSTIQIALESDTLRIMASRLQGTEEQVSDLTRVMKRFEAKIQIDVLDQKKRNVLDYFLKVNPRPDLTLSIKLRHPGAGQWFLELPEVVRWLNAKNSRIWLSGIPGAGKTVLAGLLIQAAMDRSHKIEGVGVAYFFCDYSRKETWNAVNILGAVLSQLARQNIGAFDEAKAYYDQIHPPDGLPDAPDTDGLRTAIIQMCSLFDHVLVIVDGLDECDQSTDDVVEHLARTVAPNLSLALVSRDLDNIRSQVDSAGFSHVKVEAHTEDLELYVDAELERRTRTGRLELDDPGMREEIRRTLITRAKGM